MRVILSTSLQKGKDNPNKMPMTTHVHELDSQHPSKIHRTQGQKITGIETLLAPHDIANDTYQWM
jgi:hypothetical protein